MQYNPQIKRLFDVALSATALLIFSPLFFFISIFIKSDSKGPVFFTQERIGKGFKPFKLIKFRTMTGPKADHSNQFEPGENRRVTRVGKILRRTKFDELPELFNVFSGDMSIVGPRPEVPKYLEFYRDGYTKVTEVRPGLSDFASIKYRNEEKILSGHVDPEKCYRETILPDKLDLALRYCANVSFKNDVWIILDTIKCILHPQRHFAE